MDIRPIRDDASLAWAAREIERHFDHEPESGSRESDRFDVLATLVEAYEAKHHPIPSAVPIDVLRFVMEQRGLGQTDLATLLRSRSRASEILSGKRRLTVEMIALLGRAWRIPAELLLPQPGRSPT